MSRPRAGRRIPPGRPPDRLPARAGRPGRFRGPPGTAGGGRRRHRRPGRPGRGGRAGVPAGRPAGGLPSGSRRPPPAAADAARGVSCLGLTARGAPGPRRDDRTDAGADRAERHRDAADHREALRRPARDDPEPGPADHARRRRLSLHRGNRRPGRPAAALQAEPEPEPARHAVRRVHDSDRPRLPGGLRPPPRASRWSSTTSTSCPATSRTRSTAGSTSATATAPSRCSSSR